MTVYNANLLSLRTKIEKRQAVIKKAIAKAKQRIKEGESDPRSAAARHVKANKTNLGRAEKYWTASTARWPRSRHPAVTTT